jgi:hypothetical protein
MNNPIPCRIHTRVSWGFQIVAAAILAQTLFFKFSGAEESKYIFTTLGVEPWGRVGAGMAELVAVGLLLSRRYAILGSILAMGVMSGAILSHLTRLGIVVQNDGGLLFTLAIITFGSSAIVTWLRRYQIPIVGDWLPAQKATCAAPSESTAHAH